MLIYQQLGRCIRIYELSTFIPYKRKQQRNIYAFTAEC